MGAEKGWRRSRVEPCLAVLADFPTRFVVQKRKFTYLAIPPATRHNRAYERMKQRFLVLEHHVSVPFLAPLVPPRAGTISNALTCPLPAAAAAAVLVDGPLLGPCGWISVASQDGQVRVYDIASWLGNSLKGCLREIKPLALVHLLRPVGQGPGQIHAHTWGRRISPTDPTFDSTADQSTDDSREEKEECYLATLHRKGCVVHRLSPLGSPTFPPTPCAFLQPLAEARCLDMHIFAECSPASAPCTSGCTSLVALGGSFGVELHPIVKGAEAPRPLCLLDRVPVSLLRFSPTGQHLAWASLDGRIGVIDAHSVLAVVRKREEEAAQSEDRKPAPQPYNPQQQLPRKQEGQTARFDRCQWELSSAKGERAVSMAFSSSGQRLAVACADGSVLLYRPPSRSEPPFPPSRSPSSSSWRPCPAFSCSLNAPLLPPPPAGACSSHLDSTVSHLTGDGNEVTGCGDAGDWAGGSPLPCRPSLVWSPGDLYLVVTLPGSAGRSGGNSTPGVVAGSCINTSVGSPPRLVVLDARSGRVRQMTILPRPWQGMSVGLPPRASGGWAGGSDSEGATILGVDDQGCMHVLRWRGAGGCGESLRERGRVTWQFLARGETGSLRGREGPAAGEGGDRDWAACELLWWREDGKKGQGPMEMVVRAPFLPADGCRVRRSGREELVCFDDRDKGDRNFWESPGRPQSGAFVVGKEHIGVAFPEAFYVHAWDAEGLQLDEGRSAARLADGSQWWDGWGWCCEKERLARIAFVEGEEELKVLGLLAPRQGAGAQFMRLTLLSKRKGPRPPLVSPFSPSLLPSGATFLPCSSVELGWPPGMDKDRCDVRSWRWSLLVAPLLKSRRTGRASHSPDRPFVLLGWRPGTCSASRRGSEAIKPMKAAHSRTSRVFYLWRGRITDDKGASTGVRILRSTEAQAACPCPQSEPASPGGINSDLTEPLAPPLVLARELPSVIQVPCVGAFRPVALRVRSVDPSRAPCESLEFREVMDDEERGGQRGGSAREDGFEGLGGQVWRLNLCASVDRERPARSPPGREDAAPVDDESEGEGEEGGASTSWSWQVICPARTTA